MPVHQEAPGIVRIDHGWGGPGFVASYLLLGPGGPALVEAGPASTHDALVAGLREAGVEPAELTDLLLTHIHLDHAGGAGLLVRTAPKLRVHVHPRGAPHLADPERLLASARRLYGERMEELWGTMLPVPAGRIHAHANGARLRVAGRTLQALDTPGHARHHLAFHDSDSGDILSGDVGGIRLEGARHVRPPTPPPEMETAAWLESVDRLRALAPARLLLTHFGGVEDVGWHLDDLAARLLAWTDRARALRAGGEDVLAEALRREGDADLAASGASPELVRRYAESIPYGMMAAGLLRQERSRSGPDPGSRGLSTQ